MKNPKTLRSLTPRRLLWDFSASESRYWLRGSPLLTTVLDVYTMLVPDNEKYYIRSLRPCLKSIESEAHKAELREFFRQESLHGIAHQKYWKKLSEYGVDVDRFVTVVNTLLYKILEPLQPQWLRISIVAAIEHINASLANIYLEKDLLRNASPELKRLFEWHFAEEIEHKAVAHNALQAIYPGYLTRVMGATLAIPVFFGIMMLGTIYLLARARNLLTRKVWDDASKFLFGERVLIAMFLHLFRYFRPRFHPWNLDDYILATEVFSKVKRHQIPPNELLPSQSQGKSVSAG
jgi:uncharacterized protein